MPIPDPVADRLAALSRRLDLTGALRPYEAERWTRSDDAPTLHLDDVSDIPFLVDIAGVEEYQHRARLRCGDGDLFATVTTPPPGYERYCRDCLGLGAPTHLRSHPERNLLAVTAGCGHQEPFGRLVDVARAAGGLEIHPYMGIEAVWTLARTLAAGSRLPVRVLAPPPPVTWIANDKALFAEVVEATLGAGWMPEARTATTVASLADHLADLSSRYRRVGLKRTRCASAMGNLVLPSPMVHGADPPALRAEVEAFLRRTGWPEGEAVVAVAWEDAVSSPSTQLWIPPTGPPRLDGIYEQILRGPEQVFVGARPSTLPPAVHRALAGAALRVAASLQRLGYVGRCSFDHLVLGDPDGEFTVRFTECNGRWGGTSAPMHLVDRVLGAPRPPYRSQDVVFPGLVGMAFEELVTALGPELYDRRAGTGRYLLFNVGPLRRHGKLAVIALGGSQQEADAAVEHDLPRRLGLS